MIPARARRERMIKSFGAVAAMRAFQALANRRDDFGFLAVLDDETIEAIAAQLLTDHRRTQRFNQRERARRAERVSA